MLSVPTLVRRGFTSLLSTAVLAAGLVVLADAPASAATAATDTGYNVVDRNATTGVTADPLPTAQIDGVAWDQAIVGDTVYVGGQFTTVRPAGAAAGVNTTPRSNLLSYNIKTGVFNPGFAPTVNGRIRAMAVSPDKSRLYIVGSFTTVNGVSRSRVAAFNTSDGSLVTSFAPTAGSDVFTIAVTNSAVYLGGWFTKMNGVSRTRLAAVSPTNGATLAWAPTADDTVQAMTLTPDKSRLIIGGQFANVNGSFTPGLGSVDASTGTLYPFDANRYIQNYGATASITSLKADDTTIYGTAFSYGTGTFEGMFATDPMSGVIKTLADCHGDTYDVSPVNGVIYTVSHHHDCTNMSGFPDTNPRNRWQRANAFTIDATTTTNWNSNGAYGQFYGQPSSSIVNWYPDVASGTYTGQSQGGWTTEATSEYVVQGGEFPTVNGVKQQGLVRFGVPSVATNKSGPVISAAKSVPTLLGISGSSVRVSWPANWDRDDSSLTYKVYRSDKPTTPIVTRAVTSLFWSLPTQIFTDTGLSANTTYTYYVTATDASGNTLKSASASIDTSTVKVDNSAYSSAVTNDGATHYWRLNGPAGGTGSVDSIGESDLLYGTGVTNGATGAVSGSSDTAATFDGTGNGEAASSIAEPGPDTFSAEAWFSTTSTSGGKIVGFGANKTGYSGGYDRHVYMDNAGHLVFGIYPGWTRTVTTSATYNDGKYHHVVASMSSAGMTLYVDGLLQGSDAGGTSAQGYTGYWRVGGDNIGGWPGQPASYDLAGTIDDVAIYPTALSTAQVRDHYTKSGRTVDLPPTPTDTYGKTVYADNPVLFWRLNDAAGSTSVADSSEVPDAGVISGDVALGTSSDVATGTAATFNGSGTLGSTKRVDNPTTYSEEIWFKTTSTDGGKLIGFGSSQYWSSDHYDRHVYLENSGQLTFGTYTGQLNLITSPTAYNNGTWHHVVATQDGTAGMKLYVDGVLVGSNSQTSAEGYSGYWRVGGDNVWSGNSGYLKGSVDEAAVYSTALTAAQVKAHYNASPAATNAAPAASFTTSCADAACYVDGSGSTDDGSIADWAWNFGDEGTATGSTASHTYAASGTYTVSLTVTDDKGVKTTTTKDVTATVPVPNQAPTAAYTSSCTELVCAFDSSTSADADGTIAGYAWTFGDGNTSAEASPSHTYTANGTYTVALTVTDNKGATSTETKTLTVAKNNVAPVAAFTSTVADLKVSVDGSTSADSDGTVASYAWSYGDGTTGTGKTDSHTYAAAGTYDVTLTVTDDQGLTNQVTKSVTVTAPAPVNVKPTAAFTSSAADLALSVDGSTSADSDGTVASYAWTYGDGSTGTGKTDSHTYAAAGTYDVKLTVTDNSGATDSVTKSVTVTAAAPVNVKPTAAFTSTATNLALSVDGSTSADSDGTVASYAWTYGDGSTGTGKTDSHTYAAAGSYDVKLVVTDNAGATDSVTKSVTVTAPAPVSTVVASDTFGRTGSKWGTADKGGAWTDSGATYFSTSGGKGLLAVTKAGSGPIATLNGVSALDSTTTAEFSVDKVPTGSGFYVILSSRKQGTSEYRLKARLLSDGTVRLGTSVLVNGTETSLGESATGLTYTAGQVFKVRFDVSGTGTTSLQGKIWKASASEPATAQATATNTAAGLQSAGAVAVQGYLSGSSTSAPVTVSFDNLVVTRN